MHIAVLGTGVVGRTLSSRLVEVGHSVAMGARVADNPAAEQWAAEHGGRHGTFSDSCRDAEVVINATMGLASLDVLDSIGADALSGLIIVDVANPLDFSNGFPPGITHPGGRSLGEQIQARFPHSSVVKALNTMAADVMVHPEQLSAPSSTFLAGDDEHAKATTGALLAQFGWQPEEIHDVGDITAARGLELYLHLWLRLMQSQNTALFNIRIVR